MVAAKREAAAATLDKEAPQRAAGWPLQLPLMLRSASARQYAMAAVFLIFTIGLVVVIMQNRQLRTHIAQLHNQIAQSETEKETLQQQAQSLQEQLDANSARLQQVQQELERQRQRSDEQAQELAKLLAPPPSIASLMLTSVTRDLATPATLMLTPATKSVLLTITLGGDQKSKEYRVILQTQSGEEVRRLEKPRVRSKPTGHVIVLRLPATDFINTTYKLTLIEVTRDGIELVHEYYFNVVKQ
jgi:septal ring factor EnvC (AmiA/AmiB activator)